MGSDFLTNRRHELQDSAGSGGNGGNDSLNLAFGDTYEDSLNKETHDSASWASSDDSDQSLGCNGHLNNPSKSPLTPSFAVPSVPSVLQPHSPLDHRLPQCSPIPTSPKKPSRHATGIRRWTHAGLCAAAIMISLMIYSLLQERIMTRPYTSFQFTSSVDSKFYSSMSSAESALNISRNGPSRLLTDAADMEVDSGGHAFFHNSLFLVLVNRLFAVLVAAACVAARGTRSDLSSKAALSEYATVSITNVIATSCQYEALKWLTFPTVTIGKCAKMLPVMLLLNLRSGKRYNFHDYAVAGTVLAGCAIMISSGNVVAHRAASADSDTPIGFILLIAYLFFDAATSTYQERLFAKYDMSVYNQMLYINFTSAFISIAGLTLSGGLRESLYFATSYPAIVPDITMLSLSAVAGQFAITYTIQAFGALLYAGIMTTRQFCSVLASVIIFKHGLTATQWLGALLVFSALFYKLWRKATHDGRR